MRPSRVIPFIGLFFLWLVWVNPVAAHADLVWSDPVDGGSYSEGSLSQISLKFDETLEQSFSDIEVYNSRLDRVDIGQLHIDASDQSVIWKALADLPEGDYSVLWNVVSTADGHKTTGLFQFRVGDPEGAPFFTPISAESVSANLPLAWEVIIRWLLFAAVFAAFGGLFFSFIVVRSNGSYGVGESFEKTFFRQTSRLVAGAIVLWLIANVMLLFWQSAVVGRGSPGEALRQGVPLALLQTRFGLIWVLRQVVALGLLILCRQAPAGGSRVKIVLAAIMVGTISLFSHGAANALWPNLAVLIDWSHLMANAVWLGGLITLAFVYIPIWRRSATHKGELFKVAGRFSKFAVIAVVISVVTGVFAATIHFLEPADIHGTDYGRSLLVKLALVGMALLLGLANHRSLRNKSFNLAKGITWETVLGVMILLAAAAITALPTPAPQVLAVDDIPFDGQLHQISLPEENLQAFVSLAPSYVGWNRTMVVIQDGEGLPISRAESVRVRYSLPEVDARTNWRVMAPSENGLYVAEGQDMVLVGDWQVEVDVRRQGQPDTRFQLDWPLSIPPTMKVNPSQPRWVNWLSLGLVGLVVIVLIFRAIKIYQLKRSETRVAVSPGSN